MYKFWIDEEKNRLHADLEGRVEVKDLEEMEDDVDSLAILVQKLKPGFDSITDLSKLKALTEEARMVLHDAMQILNKAGMRHAVRIIGECDAGDLKAYQFDKTSIGAGYVGRLFKTREEAEAFLDGQA